MKALLAPVTALCVGLSGCCTLFNGSTHDLSIRSTTPNTTFAVVNKKNEPAGSGTLPTQLHLKSYLAPYTVSFVSPTGQKQNYVVKQGISGWMFANLALGGAIGFGIDAATGSLYSLKPEVVNMDMATGRNLAWPAPASSSGG